MSLVVYKTAGVDEGGTSQLDDLYRTFKPQPPAKMPSPWLDFVDNVIDKTARAVMYVYWVFWVVRGWVGRFFRHVMATGYSAIVAFYVCAVVVCNVLAALPILFSNLILRAVLALMNLRDLFHHVFMTTLFVAEDYRIPYDPRHADMIAAVRGNPRHAGTMPGGGDILHPDTGASQH